MATNREYQNESYKKKPWWFWPLVYLAIGGAIYAAVYYFYSTRQDSYQTPAPSTEEAPDAGRRITLTPRGFTPTNLTIKVGQTVTWVNESGQTATVNSQPHPIHTDYPPLNLDNFADGEELSLTFTQPGTYSYHNHLNASSQGTITVVE